MAPFSPFPRAHPRGKNCGGTPKKQVLYNSPLVLQPLGLGPPRTQEGRGYKPSYFYAGRMMSMRSLMQLEMVGGQNRAEPPREGAALCCVNPVLCAFSCELACEPARPSRAFSRRVSGKRSGA